MQYKLFITYMEFIIILFLLVLNGVFAMYEIALVSSSKARLETLAGKGNKRAKGVLKQLEEPEKFLSTIQIGITLIGIVSGAFGGVAIADNVAPLFASIPGVAPYAKDLAVITTVAIITYLSLIIGELVPKSIALGNPERYATLLSPVMILLTKVSYPFVCLLSFSTKIVNKLIGLNNGEERPMTQEELKMILHQSSEQGVIDKEETEMLRDGQHMNETFRLRGLLGRDDGQQAFDDLTLDVDQDWLPHTADAQPGRDERLLDIARETLQSDAGIPADQ